MSMPNCHRIVPVRLLEHSHMNLCMMRNSVSLLSTANTLCDCGAMLTSTERVPTTSATRVTDREAETLDWLPLCRSFGNSGSTQPISLSTRGNLSPCRPSILFQSKHDAVGQPMTGRDLKGYMTAEPSFTSIITAAWVARETLQCGSAALRHAERPCEGSV